MKSLSTSLIKQLRNAFGFESLESTKQADLCFEDCVISSGKQYIAVQLQFDQAVTVSEVVDRIQTGFYDESGVPGFFELIPFDNQPVVDLFTSGRIERGQSLTSIAELAVSGNTAQVLFAFYLDDMDCVAEQNCHIFSTELNEQLQNGVIASWSQQPLTNTNFVEH